MREGSSGTTLGEIVVVGGDGDSENRALAATNINRIEGVFLAKTASLY